MFFGLDMEKIFILLVIAALVIGPERLPRYAAALAGFIRQARGWVDGARTRVKEEMGDEFDDIEWRKLDPRQYDPRRIIRDALLDDSPTPTVRAAAIGASAAATASVPLQSVFRPEAEVPFDTEAT